MDRNNWIRFLYMIVFALVLQLLSATLGLLAVIQVCAQLATGRTFGQLRNLGGQMADYARAIIAFLTFHTEVLPFPFAPAKTEDLRPSTRAIDTPLA